MSPTLLDCQALASPVQSPTDERGEAPRDKSGDSRDELRVKAAEVGEKCHSAAGYLANFRQGVQPMSAGGMLRLPVG